MVFLVVNLGTLVCTEYSSMMFIPAPAVKRIIEIVQPAKILCQALVADSENDLLKIPL